VTFVCFFKFIFHFFIFIFKDSIYAEIGINTDLLEGSAVQSLQKKNNNTWFS